MDHQKRNKVLGIVTLVFAGIALISAAAASSAGSNRYYSAEFELSPSGYIEYDFGENGLVDFTVTISLSGADAIDDGISAYIVLDDTSSIDGLYARAYHSYTYSSINALGWDDTRYNLYQSIYFSKSLISYSLIPYNNMDDYFRIVVVPAVDHDFNSQNLVVSISVSTNIRASVASSIAGYVVMLAIPAIILGISAIISAKAATPVYQPPARNLYAPGPAPTRQPMVVQQSMSPSNKKLCHICGSEVQAGQQFCGICGTALKS